MTAWGRAGPLVAAAVLGLVAACQPAAAPPAAPVPVVGTPVAGEPPAVRCTGGEEVASADELTAALRAAGPGTTIRLRDGVYDGRFALRVSGTDDAPVTLCGGRAAVLDGGSVDSSYALHLDGVRAVRLAGFTVRGGKKGLMLDATTASLVEGLRVEGVGNEAVHLRSGSSGNVVRGNEIRRTGLRQAEFGEGIYVGSAVSNWCQYSACEPDRSDGNVVSGNDIAETTAEAVDIKEGTTGGVLRGNRFSGVGMSAADSWVDVKGNDWTIVDNVGTDSPEDGFQTHVAADGWGERNVFTGNTATVNGPGYAFNIVKPDRGNTVACSNRAVGAGKDLSTIPCVTP